MAYIEPLKPEELTKESKAALDWMVNFFGTVATSVKTMVRRPNLGKAFVGLSQAINDPNNLIPRSLCNLVGQSVSRTSGDLYTAARTALNSAQNQISPEKEAALWDYETSPLYDDAERAAIRVARAAGKVPSEVTPELMADLKSHFSDDEVTEIVGVIAFYGFINRWNNTMATDMDDYLMDSFETYVKGRDWAG